MEKIEKRKKQNFKYNKNNSNPLRFRMIILRNIHLLFMEEKDFNLNLLCKA